MSERLMIPTRFRGPPDSGNGGWTCGALAAFVTGDLPAEVTLRQPPPLEIELDIDRVGDRVCLLDGDELIAEASPTSMAIEAPEAVAPDRALVAEAAYEGHVHHPFDSCFTCGPARDAGDGLRIFPGPVDGLAGVVASTWTPAEEVTAEIIWAALDCPSGWAHITGGDPAVLGRMATVVHGSVETGEDYVVVGAHTGEDGRKRFANSALFTAGGQLVAAARSTWITIDLPEMGEPQP